MNKIKSTIVLALLLATALTPSLPFLAARASTGFIIFGPSQYIPAGGNVSLSFTGVGFSGGQFYLVWSADGFSQISAGDFKYSPTFAIADLVSTTPTIYTSTLGNYTVGNDKIFGPIPKDIGGGHYYIKCYDGSATSVAVTNNYIQVLPSLEVVPSTGGPGTSITLKGHAFSPSAKANLTYTSTVNLTSTTIANLISTGSIGQFSYIMKAPDLKQALSSGQHLITFNTIHFYGIDNKTGYIANANYTEGVRGLLQVDSKYPVSGDMYGNMTSFINVVNAHVFDSMIVSGNYFYVGGLTFWWDGSKNIGTVNTNSSGFYNTSVTIPITSVGNHYVIIKDKNVNLQFNITVLPTLVLTPSSGPIGTQVSAQAYGFPTKIHVYLYWFEKTYGDDTYYWTNNATTGSDGQFNVSVKFTVPHTYGGGHAVEALTNYLGTTNSSVNGYNITNAVFTVTPKIAISSSSFSNDGSLVTVTGTGFNPVVGYIPDIDNQYLGQNGMNITTNVPSGVIGNGTGDGKLQFVAAGFTSGLHVFSMYAGGSLTPTYLLFTVTGNSADTQAILNQMTTNNNAITTSLNQLQTSMSSITTSITSLNTALTTGVSNIRSDIAGVSSSVSSLSSTTTSGFSSVNNAIGTLNSGVSGLSGISSKIDSLGSTLGTQITGIGSKIDSLSTQVTSSANSITSAISSQRRQLAALKQKWTAYRHT